MSSDWERLGLLIGTLAFTACAGWLLALILAVLIMTGVL